MRRPVINILLTAAALLIPLLIIAGLGCSCGGGPGSNDDEDTTKTVPPPGGDFTETAAGIDIKMILVAGGTYTMGCETATATYADSCYPSDRETPPHLVTVDSFFIGKYEVTQRQWKAIMGTNPAQFKGDDLPVERVSWRDAGAFLTKLNELTKKNYRLPTNAEWEYAARGGIKNQGYKFCGSQNIGEVAWYAGNSGGETQPVGTKKANELGICDMSGNVYEWVSDWYGSYVRSQDGSPVLNPQGPESGLQGHRTLRGGSFNTDARANRASARSSSLPDGAENMYGFRVALPK